MFEIRHSELSLLTDVVAAGQCNSSTNGSETFELNPQKNNMAKVRPWSSFLNPPLLCPVASEHIWTPEHPTVISARWSNEVI